MEVYSLVISVCPSNLPSGSPVVPSAAQHALDTNCVYMLHRALACGINLGGCGLMYGKCVAANVQGGDGNYIFGIWV